MRGGYTISLKSFMLACGWLFEDSLHAPSKIRNACLVLFVHSGAEPSAPTLSERQSAADADVAATGKRYIGKLPIQLQTMGR